jgi:hypothetical protein
MHWFCVSLSTALLIAVSISPASAQLTSPQVGWEADFNEIFHDVLGTVSVLDPNTLLFDGFTYDGGVHTRLLTGELRCGAKSTNG